MNCEKYIGLDVHQATTIAAVRDSNGKLLMESILETKSEVLLQFFAGLRGTLHVTLEEGTWRATGRGGRSEPHGARVSGGVGAGEPGRAAGSAAATGFDHGPGFDVCDQA